MKEFWLEKDKCTGCGMCSNICHKHAIEMVPDECGFVYPQMNTNCVDCNKCENKCKLRSSSNENYAIPKTFASWSKN